MIRRLSDTDTGAIYDVVNLAAVAYKGKIPADRYHEPYMPLDELRREMAEMTFYGWEEAGDLLGVMAIQPVKDVTLIRHAYVRPAVQQQGIGSRLLEYLKQITKTNELLVGTWADAVWAVDFYQKHGFRLRPDKDALLKKYWDIPERQVETSVVLSFKLKTA